MFDWLFGDGGKQRKQNEEQLDALRTQRADADVLSQVFNNRISSGNYNNDNVGTIMDAGDSYGQFVKDADTQTADLEKSLKQSRYDYFGNGLLGAILNPIGQTATAGFDLATGQYENNDRDMWSDIGAAGQTALSFLPFAGGLARVGGVAGKMAAGVGAAFGAGIPIAGKIGGNMLRNRGSKVLGNELAKSGVADDAAQQFMSSVPNKALYQTALRSFVPKSTVGKLAVGGGALYGASRLMGGGQQPDPGQQLVAEFTQMYGREPSEYELQLLTAGGY